MKKRYPLPLFLLFFGTFLQAQPCPVPTAYGLMKANNITVGATNKGILFNNGSDGVFRPGDGLQTTVYAAGLWIGGIDPGGNLKLAVADYPSSTRSDFFAGPLDEQADCKNWDKIFTVTSAEISAFLGSLPIFAADPNLAIALYPGIMGWPAHGNPYFSTVHGFDLPDIGRNLAGYTDVNGDNFYNPLQGDYPSVLLRNQPPFVPGVQMWTAFNDYGNGAAHTHSFGDPLEMEVQQTLWAFNCPDDALINNTVFCAHKLTNLAAENLDSVYVGTWADFDIGCPFDDYVGSYPGKGFFAYNQDAVDGQPGSSCDGGISSFGDHPPVQSVTYLDRDLDKMLTLTDGSAFMGDPSTPGGFYRYLSGRFLDGTPPTFGGSGYNPGGGTPVDYMFSDNPADANGWSMCTANLPFGDRRALGSVYIERMQPYAIEEIVTAWAVHPNPDLPCGLGSMYADMDRLRTLYNDHFSGLCSQLLKNPEAEPNDSLDLFPNPAAAEFTLVYGDRHVQSLEVFAADGRLVTTLKNLPAERVTVPVQAWPAGVYTVRAISDKGDYVSKLSIAR